ncbi:MAG: DUF1292 domain-containing protein [Oscillospiraceae bacterium]|nr:DUF1292 domain-containing protein [Oscillospiraceae bacterium]
MFSEQSSEIITLTDENGEIIAADVVDTMTYKDKTYIAIVPIGEDFGDDDLYALEKRVDKKGEEYFEEIEDDCLFEKIIGIFARRIEEREDAASAETVMKYEL